MGNQINNKSQINETIEDKHLIFSGYSNKLSELNNNDENYKIQINILLDKEDTTISKVVEATLNKNDKSNYFYLEDYVNYLQSNSNPIKFRIKNFEEITEFVMKNYNNPLEYLLKCYHRSIELIEIKSRDEYDDSYLKS